MAQLIKPQQVKVVTKDGECHITLDVNITLNSGIVEQVGINAREATIIKKEEKESEIKDFQWEIPDFEVSDEKINFGEED